MASEQGQRVNLVGPGRVGQTLMRRIAEAKGYHLGDVAGAHPDRVRQATAAALAGRAVERLEDMAPAAIWILTVPDGRIAEVAEALSRSPRVADWGRPRVCHCSGFHGLDVLSPLAAKGWRAASFHPMMSFSDPEAAALRFPGTLCGIEGEAADLVEALGGTGFPIQQGQKALYHAAAVFSSNFTVVLQAIALAAWKEAGVPSKIAARLAASLLTGTAANVARDGAALALTGPAARGEEDVIRQEEAVLAAWRPEAAALYRDLTALARDLKAKGSVCD